MGFIFIPSAIHFHPPTPRLNSPPRFFQFYTNKRFILLSVSVLVSRSVFVDSDILQMPAAVVADNMSL